MKLIPTTVLLSLIANSALSQLPPPITPATNTFHLEVWYATDGINYTNPTYIGSTVVNVSTNGIPWSEGYGANPPGSPWTFGWTGYATNQLRLTWTWGKQNIATNFLIVTNSPVDCCETTFTFYVYPILDTNAATMFMEVWAPTNKDPNAVICWYDYAPYNKWRVEANNNGQYYGNNVSEGEYLGPDRWKTSNSTYDPIFRIRYFEKGQVFKTITNHPNW